MGKLSDVMKAVRDVAANLDVALNSAVTVVDASKCKMYMKNFGEFFNNQVAYAGTIILSRTDVADVKKVDAAVKMLREANPKAVIVTTPVSQLTGAQLLEIIEKPDTMEEELMMKEALEAFEEHHHHHHDHEHEHDHDHEHEHHHEHHHEHGEECGCGHDHHHEHGEECSCGHDHHHHHADEVFSSWGTEHVQPISREELEKILDELAYGADYGDVLRSKGMVPGTEGQWFYFDLVPEEYEIRTGNPDYTGKVCVIGANLKEEELEKAFSRS